jgi:hypothetical protein
MGELQWPFRAAEALNGGSVTVRELRRFYAPVYPGVWAPAGVELSVQQRTRAAWLWSGRRGVIAGLSAAALLGAKWVEPDLPAELIHTNRRTPGMLAVYSEKLAPGETQRLRGMTVTTPARTAFDIGRRQALATGVQRIDALMNATDVKVIEVEALMTRRPGVRGLRQLRQTLAMVDGGAESPYESRTRLLLVQAGFPRPETQIPVRDELGYITARVDMGYRKWLVAVEFDGAQHWTDARQRSRDIDRLAKLEAMGWIVVRVESGLLHRDPATVIARVGQALESRGCPKTW